MVDSNLHREGLLPSEKGFAYKMKLEAMKHQGRTSAQVGQKLTSVQALADSSSDSKTQVQRYIRLTFLEKPLLDLVDVGRSLQRDVFADKAFKQTVVKKLATAVGKKVLLF